MCETETEKAIANQLVEIIHPNNIIEQVNQPPFSRLSWPRAIVASARRIVWRTFHRLGFCLRPRRGILCCWRPVSSRPRLSRAFCGFESPQNDPFPTSPTPIKKIHEETQSKILDCKAIWAKWTKWADPTVIFLAQILYRLEVFPMKMAILSNY